MSSGRRQSIDVYRGVAILAMVAYHTVWDLTYYRLIETGIGSEAPWVALQRGILGAFLVLAGAGLWLAHGNGVNWRGFWRRELVVTAAAAGVSAVTWLQFGPYFSFFGVLHAIALGSLLTLPLVRAPLWAGIGVAIAVLFLPAVYASDAFNDRTLAWIGFFTTTPETADLVPVFPWLGVIVVGMLGARLLAGSPMLSWESRAWPARWLARIGRWSLVIYLVHQPLLFGIVTPIAQWAEAQQTARLEGFLQQCRSSCAPQGTAAFCTAYCACALDVTIRDRLWDAPKEELGGLVKLCTEMAK